jgi:prohibitin 2
MAANSKQKLMTSVLTGGAVLVLMFTMNAFAIVEPGYVGVVTHFGAVQKDVLPEGLHIVMPFRTKVVPINVRIQKIEATASASSKDLQVISSKVALNYYLDKSQANIIFQKLGIDYKRTILEPTLQESVKSATAQYTAEQLITKRSEVKETISAHIKIRLKKNNIILTEFSIVDFSFSREFNRAIEEKQVAEQSALRAKNDLDRIKIEAMQVLEKAAGEANARLEMAKAEAESQKLLRETVDDRIIKLRAIEKWDGVLPVSMGSDSEGTFFDVVGAVGMQKRAVRDKAAVRSSSAKKAVRRK